MPFISGEVHMKKTLLTTSCIATLGLCAVPALAQTATPQAAAEQDNAGLGEIIVTAQRREENLQKAAIAVSAVSADQLVRGGVTDTTQLTNLVPSLQIAKAAGPYALFYLRGVGNFNANALSDSAIAFNIDGVFVARPSSTGGVLYDIDRIEVLKGPQGTLYGRNATGGAVNVITRKPQLGKFGGDASVSYGNYDAIQFNGALNAPLGERAAVRVAGQYVKHDGYMSDGTSDQNDLSGRIQLKFEASDAITINLGGDYYRQKGRGLGSTVLTDAVTDRRVGITDPRSRPAFNGVYFFPSGNTLQLPPNDQFVDTNSWGVYGSLDADIGFADLTVIPAYRGGSINYRATTPSFLINQREKDKQFTLETRLASKSDGSFEWLLGAFYIKEDINVPLASFNQQVSGSVQSFFPKTESYAGFARATYKLTDRFRVTGGIRYTHESKKFDGTFNTATLLCGGTVLTGVTGITGNCFGAPLLANTPGQGFLYLPSGAPVPFAPFGLGANFPGGPATTPSFFTARQFQNHNRASFNKTTWRAGVEYDVADRSLLYASVETGFKSGGFFFTTDNPVYDPETIQAWTVGSKNRFFDNRLQLNVELFYWKYKGQQVSSVSRDSGGNVVFATRNIGASTNKGLEIEAIAKPGRNTQVSMNLQYLDARYDSFVYTTPNNSPQVPGLLTLAPPTANCPFNLGTPTTVYIQDCSGRRPVNAPEWVASFGVQQTVPLGDWKLVLNASTRLQSDVITGLEYLPAQTQDGYTNSDASITLAQADDRYFVTAYVNNIENNDIIGNSFPNPFGGAALLAGSLRPPRTYGIRAGVKF
jgi:iron complex outermembrane recepter protein